MMLEARSTGEPMVHITLKRLAGRQADRDDIVQLEVIQEAQEA